MSNVNFYDVLQRSCQISRLFGEMFHDLLPESSDIDINLLWDKLADRFSSLYPEYQIELLDSLKNDITISLYSATRYANSKEINSSEIAAEFIKTDMANNSSYAPDGSPSVRSQLSNYKQQLRKLTDRELVGPTSDSTALQYFYPYCRNDSLKVFSAFDFYVYLKEYKHWPYNPDNKRGMSLTELLDSYHRIFINLFSIPEKNNNEFEANFSAFIFERLFHPIALTDFIITYLEYFSDMFYKFKSDSHTNLQEKLIRVLAMFFNLPHSVRNIHTRDYCSTLKDYINELDSKDKENKFFQSFDSAMTQYYCLYPVLQALFCDLLVFAFKGNFAAIEETLKDYSSKSYINYRSIISNNFEQLEDLNYPQGSQKSQSNIPVWKINKDKDRQKGRNNKTIENFELNITYFLYNDIKPLNHVLGQAFQVGQLGNLNYTLDIMHEKLSNILWSDHSSNDDLIQLFDLYGPKR